MSHKSGSNTSITSFFSKNSQDSASIPFNKRPQDIEDDQPLGRKEKTEATLQKELEDGQEEYQNIEIQQLMFENCEYEDQQDADPEYEDQDDGDEDQQHVHEQHENQWDEDQQDEAWTVQQEQDSEDDASIQMSVDPIQR